MDLPGGNSLMQIIDCAPQDRPGRQFFVGHFVPIHQVIELEYWRNEQTEPQRMRLPLAEVRRFE